MNKVQMLLATRRGYDYWLQVVDGEPVFLGNTDMKFYAETGADIEISDEDLATLKAHLEQ